MGVVESWWEMKTEEVSAVNYSMAQRNGLLHWPTNRLIGIRMACFVSTAHPSADGTVTTMMGGYNGNSEREAKHLVNITTLSLAIMGNVPIG